MIRKTFGMLVAVMLVLCISSFAFARGAPTKQKAFASNVAVTEQAAPVANLVPVMIGYDVIQNLSESRVLFIAQNTFDVDTSAQMRQSPTVDWCDANASYHGNARSSPAIVMIA